DFEMLSEQKPLIKKAYGVLKELSQDEKTRLLAEAREAYQWDIVASNRNAKAEGLREGIEKGEEQKAINIAKNMLKRGTPIEYILEDTGLDINTIKKLQNEK
ncbi:MAG: transposase, partial [Defluviitaleaceae bacterium]|nr:transposase [Defluviitaleaceae bacterium]